MEYILVLPLQGAVGGLMYRVSQLTQDYTKTASLTGRDKQSCLARHDAPQKQDSVVFAGSAPSRRQGWFQRVGLALALAVSGLQAVPVSAAMQTTPRTAVTETQKLTHQPEDHALTDAEKARYQAMEKQFQAVQAMPNDSIERHETIANLQQEWQALRENAKAGDDGARLTLHALWINRMFDELVNPSPQLVHLDDRGWDPLVKQHQQRQFSDNAFTKAVQKRALKGLSMYFQYRRGDNELLRDNSRLFKPVLHLLQTQQDTAFQQDGHEVMRRLAKDLTLDQQAQFLEWAASAYLKAKPGTEKLELVKSLAEFYEVQPDHPSKQILLAALHQNLVQVEEGKTQQEAQKTDIVLLGLLKDPQLTQTLTPFVSPQTPPTLQQASAWSLGAAPSREGLQLLIGMVKHPDIDPLSKEMALTSLAEYAKAFPKEVTSRLAQFAGNTTLSQDLREVAQAMQEKLLDTSDTIPDFYINKYLKTDAEKETYRTLRDQYVEGLQHLTTAQKNMVDNALIPYRDHLPIMTSSRAKHIIVPTNLSDIKRFKSYIGERQESGVLTDIGAIGFKMPDGTHSSAHILQPGEINGFAHEFTHHLHENVLNPKGMGAEIEGMYQAARQKGQFLDRYAAANAGEYFAQGNEAMSSPYKSHAGMYTQLFNNGFDTNAYNTQSELKRVDPALYQFLKSLRQAPDHPTP